MMRTLRFALTLTVLLSPTYVFPCSLGCQPAKFWPGFQAGYGFSAEIDAMWQGAFEDAAMDWNIQHASHGIGGLSLWRQDENPSLFIRLGETSNPNWAAEWNGQGEVVINIYSWNSWSHDQRVAIALHELGHQMGYDDVFASGCSNCTVMSQGLSALLHLGEMDEESMDWYYGGRCESGQSPPPGAPVGGDPYCTPLILSFRGELPRLTEPLVSFDLGATGTPLVCGWMRDGRDPLLALDRNENGIIDDGSELFGNATPLLDMGAGARAWNGFQALEQYDRAAHGGNANGLIDPGDAVFSALVAWFDTNTDAVTQTWELIPISRLNILRISLAAYGINEVDRHGNIYLFGSTFTYRRGSSEERIGSVVDAVLRVQ